MIDASLEKLLNSKNYADICPDTVRRVYAQCRARYKKTAEADKAARRILHGICGAFMTRREAQRLGERIDAWGAGRTGEALEALLACHASTRERLPLSRLESAYGQIFSVTRRPGSVLDLACGINPIYLGAMGIPVTGVDISQSAVDAVNAFGSRLDLPVNAICSDILCSLPRPSRHYDLALMLKLVPLLERQQPGRSLEIIRDLDAGWIVVSFPTRTLGGKNVGMAQHYSHSTAQWLPPGRTVVKHFETENELFCIVR